MSSFASHDDFYRAVYGRYVTEVRPAGRIGAVMLQAEQPAGDWSDAPTPDLVIGRLVGRQAAASIDLGHGRFHHAMHHQQFIVVAPQAGSSIQMESLHTCQVIAVPYHALRQLTGPDALPADGDFGRLHACASHDAEVTAVFDRLWHEGQAGNPHGALLADGLLLQLSAALLRLRAPAPARQPVRGGLAPTQLRRVTDHLQAHLADDVSLAELAALAGLSVHHFCRAFRQSTGAPPHRWRLARRVERAQELLAATDWSMTEIGAAVGYDDPSQFATAFRQATGLTPTQWRRERRS